MYRGVTISVIENHKQDQKFSWYKKKKREKEKEEEKKKGKKNTSKIAQHSSPTGYIWSWRCIAIL